MEGKESPGQSLGGDPQLMGVIWIKNLQRRLRRGGKIGGRTRREKCQENLEMREYLGEEGDQQFQRLKRGQGSGLRNKSLIPYPFLCGS